MPKSYSKGLILTMSFNDQLNQITLRLTFDELLFEKIQKKKPQKTKNPTNPSLQFQCPGLKNYHKGIF